jgi:hypothetical protein
VQARAGIPAAGFLFLLPSFFRNRTAAARRGNLVDAFRKAPLKRAAVRSGNCRRARTRPAAASHPPERDRVRARKEQRRVKRGLPAALSNIIPTGEMSMVSAAAYLIALALTLLILVVLWEGLS